MAQDGLTELEVFRIIPLEANAAAQGLDISSKKSWWKLSNDLEDNRVRDERLRDVNNVQALDVGLIRAEDIKEGTGIGKRRARRWRFKG